MGTAFDINHRLIWLQIRNFSLASFKYFYSILFILCSTSFLINLEQTNFEARPRWLITALDNVNLEQYNLINKEQFFIIILAKLDVYWLIRFLGIMLLKRAPRKQNKALKTLNGLVDNKKVRGAIKSFFFVQYHEYCKNVSRFWSLLI